MIQLVNTWNGGSGGRVVVYKGDELGAMRWVHQNTPFSYHQALSHQGFEIQPAEEEEEGPND